MNVNGQNIENKLVHGYVKQGFEPVYDEFVKNFKNMSELGAQLCIYSKGITSICIAKLHSEGKIDYNKKNLNDWEIAKRLTQNSNQAKFVVYEIYYPNKRI